MKTKITFFAMFVFSAITINSFAQTHNKHEKRHIKTATENNHSAFKALLNDYTFSMITGTYSNLVNSTPIVNLNSFEYPLWDDPTCIIPIGFDFQLYNDITDSLFMGVGLGGLVSSYQCVQITDSPDLILPFEADLEDRGWLLGTPMSPMSYKLEGIVGSRILKIEWKNAGFYEEEDSLGTLFDYVNFQLWLYEGSNKIEMHYGPSSVTNPTIDYDGETGAIIGVSDYDALNPYFLTGPVNNPVVNDSDMYINGTPANGTIYIFTKMATGVNNDDNIISSIYPNPVDNYLTVNLNKNINADVKIINTIGQTVLEDKINGQHKNINMSSLNKGIYFLKLVTSANSTIIRKIIKK